MWLVTTLRIREALDNRGREGQTEEKDRNKLGKHYLLGIESSGGQKK